MAAQDIVFAVTQVIRLGGAIKDFLEARVLEADIKVALEKEEQPLDYIEYAMSQPDFVSGEAVEVARPFLVRGGFDRDACAKDPIALAEIEHFARQRFFDRRRVLSEKPGLAGLLALDRKALIEVAHWHEGASGASPGHRLGLALLGVALDAAAAYPKVFTAEAEGQKLITAFLGNVATLLPDPANADHFRVGFLERTASILLTAGARVIDENADVIWDQPRLRDLGRALVGPLRTRFEAAIAGDGQRDPYALVKVQNVRDELLAPMTQAALGVVAQNQQAFLGKAFAGDSVLGAVTEAFLAEALDVEKTQGHVLRVFSRSGFVGLYQRTLTIVAEKPELFIHGKSEATAVARNVLTAAANALSAGGTPLPYKRDVAARVAAAAIEAVADGLPRLFKLEEDKPWDTVGVSVLQSIMSGFAEVIRDPTDASIERVLGREQAIEVVRLIAAQAALTPGMIVGEGANTEVQRIAKFVAELISKPGADLLSPIMWNGVIASLLREAAANPGALFSIDGEGEGALAAHLVSDLFEYAATSWEARGGRRPELRLFGETLAEAAVTVARAAVRNARAAVSAQGRQAALDLAKMLDGLAADPQTKLSDHDWRFLYKTWIAQVIETGAPPEPRALIDALYVRRAQRSAPTEGSESGGNG